MFSRILVALDGSEYSRQALRYAMEIAKKFGARLTLLHVVVRPLHVYGDEGVVLTEAPDKRLEEEGQKVLRKAKEQAEVEGVGADTMMVVGDPAEELLRVSKEGNDLMVLGSRGLSRVRAFLLGSVSSRISHHAKCPVLIVKPLPQQEPI